MPHALLVSGRPGIGKVDFARQLARSLLCESPIDRLACGQCPSCHWFGQSNHPDYREIVPEAAEEGDADAAEADAGKDAKKSLVIKIDQVRRIRDFVALTTHRAGHRAIVSLPGAFTSGNLFFGIWRDQGKWLAGKARGIETGGDDSDDGNGVAVVRSVVATDGVHGKW